MLHHLSNQKLQISVRAQGAELASLRSLHSQTEYLWQADPQFWGGSAPVLFPIVGALKNESYQHQGKSYHLPRHGFARRSSDYEFQATENSLHFVLRANETTQQVYPFRFELEVIYRLHDSSLTIEHQISNHGHETMWFSLGAHPAFNCPQQLGEQYTDYYLEFDQTENLDIHSIAEGGLIGLETTRIAEQTRIIDLNKQLFAQDALVFKSLKSRSCSLRSRTHGNAIRVDYAGFPYLGIWAAPGADFVCIEPWLGIADSVDADGEPSHKELIQQLAPGEKRILAYTIHVEEA